MADFRNIHTRIWKDTWFSELSTDAKLLFIYLFSNERASVCGMYELPLKYIVFETGINQDRVSAIMSDFEHAGKAYYRNGIVWVVNLRKYNDSGDSVKVRIRADKDMASIPDCELKRMYFEKQNIPYPETGIPYPEIDSDTETEKRQIRDISISPELDLYHEVTGLYPDVLHEDEVKRNVMSLQEKKRLPRDGVKRIMMEKYELWKTSRTADGRLYSPSNPKWLEWCITGYSPDPPPDKRKRKSLLPEGV